MLLQNVILGNVVRNNVRITCKGRVKLSVRIPSGQSHQHVGMMNLMISIWLLRCLLFLPPSKLSSCVQIHEVPFLRENEAGKYCW